jgi:hypothetical protein
VSWLAATVILLAAITARAAGGQQSCLPEFPFREGWWGADGGYSILLTSGQTLWIFDDSFVGTSKNKNRSGTRMVNSTIAFGSCDPDGKFTVRYIWGGQGTRHPEAVFPPVPNQYKYWPENGFTHGKDVYVALSMVRDRPDLQGAFSWEFTGTRLARIRNADRPFAEWRIDYLDLYHGKVFPGQSAVRQDGYIYLFSPTETGDAQHAPTFLTRFRESSLDAASPKIELQYLAKDESWKPIPPRGIDFADAKAVMDDPFAANSVWFEPERKRWIAVGQNAVFRSNQAVVRTAESLTGPWSAPSLLYRIPDADPANGADKDTWCYQTLAHPEFRRGDQVLLTYACNSLEFGKLVKDLRIYVPKAVYVPLP